MHWFSGSAPPVYVMFVCVQPLLSMVVVPATAAMSLSCCRPSAPATSAGIALAHSPSELLGAEPRGQRRAEVMDRVEAGIELIGSDGAASDDGHRVRRAVGNGRVAV